MLNEFEIDLSEAFSWIGSADLTFGALDENTPDVPACHVLLKSDDQKRMADLIILQLGQFRYKVGGTVTTIDHEDGSEMLELRHPLLLSQEFSIPAALPKDRFLFGPLNEVNMLRIVRLVQSTLREDQEMKDSLLYTLGLSFPSDEDRETEPYVAGKNVVSLFGASLPKHKIG